MTPDPKRVVLAYSGGLDTSVILRWLIERYRCEVVAFCADLGQGEELVTVRDKAMRTGAAAVHIMDLREEFVRDFIFPMLRANAVYEGAYLLGTSIARPLIARAQVEVAAKEGADAVAHGATGKGNDQVRFELTYAALAPALRVIAPWREWELDSRTSLIDFARRHDIPVPVTVERAYNGHRGSLQFWIDNCMTEGERIKKKLQPPSPIAWNQQMFKVRLFDNLVYSIDRNLGNLLITTTDGRA